MSADGLEQCPYVPSHRLAAGTRMQQHLRKCRNEQLDNPTSPWHEKAKQMQICRFNQTHHVLNKEEHERICKDRDVVAKLLAQAKDEAPSWRRAVGNLEDEVPPVPIYHADDELWDDAFDTQSYDPQKKIGEAKGKLLLNPQGMKYSARRDYRYTQRVQAADGNADDWGDDNNVRTAPAKPSEPSPQLQSHRQPLRRPKFLQNVGGGPSLSNQPDIYGRFGACMSLSDPPAQGPRPALGVGRGRSLQPPPGFGPLKGGNN